LLSGAVQGGFSYNSRPFCAESGIASTMSETSAPAVASSAPPTAVETVIIGAGPIGLFQIFELGLLGINAHIIDSLPQVGGQCTELYPEKPIYDIPALPICGAQELIDRLLEQAKPFQRFFCAAAMRFLASGLSARFTAAGFSALPDEIETFLPFSWAWISLILPSILSFSI